VPDFLIYVPRRCQNTMEEKVEDPLTDDKVAPAGPETPPAEKAADDGELRNELNEPRWAVIGANDRTVRHLTYEQAIECLNVLDSEGIFGLCIVTDETAERLLSFQGQA